MSSFVIDNSTGCWNWIMQKDRKGYGKIGYCGTPRGAHRVSYELHCGEIPKGMHVLHRCDNPSCMNPAHLFLGSNAVNMADRNAKGRQQRGSNHGLAKLAEDDAIAIRTATGITLRGLAERYGVCLTTVKNIRSGKIWTHV
jgi:hypothetical protein